MADTSTFANTRTNTFLRKVAIKANIKLAFRKIMNYDDNYLQNYIDEIDSQNISQITFWSYKVEGFQKVKYVELILSVDWNKYEEFILKGEKEITLPNKTFYQNGELPETSTAIELFLEMTKHFETTTTFSVSYSDIVYSKGDYEYSRINKKLGLVKSSEIVNWAGDAPFVLSKYSPNELPEYSASVIMAGEK